jgi:3-hydroxyisobutyrate dehydrogenase-like beta-hydroxyacid dehydrogenase
MGYPMALNLRKGLDDSHTLLICDVSKDALTRFQQDSKGHGPVSVVDSGYQAIQHADTVITMLPDSNAVRKVYIDPTSGILAGAEANSATKSDKLIMECGTIETSTILEVAKATDTSSASDILTFVDAPVSGGPMGAQDGTLAFMAGANNKAIFPRVKEYLSHMGKPDAIFLCGDIGAGTAFKVINNYLSAITSLAASEALNIGTKMGLMYLVVSVGLRRNRIQYQAYKPMCRVRETMRVGLGLSCVGRCWGWEVSLRKWLGRGRYWINRRWARLMRQWGMRGIRGRMREWCISG